ncbi:lipopolysaccharide biosynthesis protein [Anaerobacillus alkalidiazotrophicus]|uniref:lipopolysaccharide biosynthesis protein n=1 Tax=Anaerobacillus alkalidiazotrophicus TaxID=472963 RepID=UPI00147122A0|nr:oligosaccharide flippase family protein [Anaerobacillus alkalidiazotrophicus]
MKKTNKYLKAGSFYLIGNLFNKGIAFLTIPIFTRILTTYEYGIINTYASWVAIMTMVLGMTFHMGIRSAFNDYKNKVDNFMSAITFFSIISAFSLSLLILVMVLMLPIDVNLALILMCLVQGFFAAIIQNYSMYLMMNLRYKWRTVLLVFPNLFINLIAILAIFFVFENNAHFGKIIPSVLVTSLFGFILIILIFRKSKVLINKTYWKYALSISLPIILHGLSLNILTQSDRIMITSFVGASETGVYSLVYNFSMIATVVIVSLEGVWIPWFNKKLNERNLNQINDKVNIYIAIMSYMTVAIILVSPEILKLMAPKEYWHGKIIIPLIVLSSFMIFVYTLYVNIEHFHKKTKIIALNTILAAISNIVLNFIFIPIYGMYAAAFTTLISYIISLVLHYKYARKIEKDLFSLKILVKPLILILIMIVVYYIFIESSIIRWSILGIFSLYMILKEKRIILDYYKNDQNM